MNCAHRQTTRRGHRARACGRGRVVVLGLVALVLAVSAQLSAFSRSFSAVPAATTNTARLAAAVAGVISNAAPKSFLALPAVSPSVVAVPPVGSRGSTTLAWDASPDVAVIGYRIYWGGASGNYTNSLDAKSKLTATVTGLVEGSTYFFAATAYDASGVESRFSNEATNTISFLVAMRPAADYIEGYGRAGMTNIFEVSTNLNSWTALKTFRGSGQLTNTIYWRSNAAQSFFRIRTK